MGDSAQFNFEKYVDPTLVEEKDEKGDYEEQEKKEEAVAEDIQDGVASTSSVATTSVGIVSVVIGLSLSLFWGLVNTIQMFEFLSLV